MSQEHTHFSRSLVRVTLQLIGRAQLDARAGAAGGREEPTAEQRRGADWRQRYKDYLRVMSSPYDTLEEYCDSLWLEKRPPRGRGKGLPGAKWKHIQEMKKSRNRRHHAKQREEEQAEPEGRREKHRRAAEE